ATAFVASLHPIAVSGTVGLAALRMTAGAATVVLGPAAAVLLFLQGILGSTTHRSPADSVLACTGRAGATQTRRLGRRQQYRHHTRRHPATVAVTVVGTYAVLV